MEVPFLDLKAQYKNIRQEIDSAIKQVLDETAFAGGRFVADFERDFSAFCNCRHCAGVGSGTDALWLALMAMGVGPGDEVITVPNSFIATAEAISFCGATPEFIDVDDSTYTMDPQRLHDYLKIRGRNPAARKRLKGVIPVHLFGQTADMDPILQIAREQGLFVIEDACQAHGAQYKGQPAGSLGDMGCFSFYPGKNLGAYGEAGAVVTNNKEAAEKIMILRDHGQVKKYSHTMVGWNARMDGIQGAVLTVKLRHLPAWLEARRKNAARYDMLLEDIYDVVTPKEADYARHVYHIYAIRVENRDAIAAGLASRKIHCGIHYPVPIHLTEAYRSLGYTKNSFPVSEKCADQYISLPMYPELKDEQIDQVCMELQSIVSEEGTESGQNERELSYG
ncbi:MAG: DegT/DnrJ/EryC1/StrS family aminotransferase [Candidatus Desulfacyla sp.]